MTVRRFLRAAALGTSTVLALGPLAACDGTGHSAAPAAGGGTPPAAGSVRTLPPSELCTVLTRGVAERLVPGARLTTRVGPDKGSAPDVCGYAAADGTASLSLTPASRAYPAELAAAHDLRAHPGPAGMRDVRVESVGGLGRRAFRESAYQVQAGEHLTFVVWNAGTRTWVLTSATTAKGAAAAYDGLVEVARSITARLPVRR
ncbi:hypothetical protein [Streptomyces sp. NPDC057257]|uniref:hypothetical protein n=1 Tax=Streptomyces sp. NPDC057257 TaxID=3346071 RepID=UPI00363B8BFD